MLDYKKVFLETRDLYLGTVKVISDLEQQVKSLNLKVKNQKDEIQCLKMKLPGRSGGANERKLPMYLR